MQCPPEKQPATSTISDLYTRHGPRWIARARAILGSDDLARDAVQEALLHCWLRPAPPPDAEGWMMRTVIHRALHHSRSRSRRRRHEEWVATTDERTSFQEHASDQQELSGLVEAALADLPAPFARAFAAAEIEGLDCAAIARREGVALATVRTRLHRARALLRQRLGRRLAEDPWCLDCARERRDDFPCEPPARRHPRRA